MQKIQEEQDDKSDNGKEALDAFDKILKDSELEVKEIEGHNRAAEELIA